MKRIFCYVIIVMTCSIYSCKNSQQAEYQKPDTGLIGPDATDVNMSNYTLTKSKPVSASSGLTDKYWKLVEIMGRPVASSKAHIQFKADGTINGSLGCNTFYGDYTTPQETRIRFSNIINTLKMCMDMSVEDDLKQALNMADSYNLNGNQLILNRARMAPLARFEVVYM